MAVKIQDLPVAVYPDGSRPRNKGSDGSEGCEQHLFLNTVDPVLLYSFFLSSSPTSIKPRMTILHHDGKMHQQAIALVNSHALDTTFSPCLFTGLL